MKNLLKVSLVTAIIILGTACCNPAYALGWNTVAGLGKKSINPTAEYKLNTSGNSPRVYEFHPEGNKRILCVFIAGTKSSGLSCVKQ